MSDLTEMARNLTEQQKLMDELGRLGANKKLALYKTAYDPFAQCYVRIEECVIYEDRYGARTPILRCAVTGGDRPYWFRPEELTNFVL